jgi:putative adenylate-forming enzyme
MKAHSLLLTASHFVAARWRWQHLRGATLREYQERRARQVVAYAARHAPFYRAHWQGHDLRDWRTLPTVDKQTMMSHFDTFNTRGIALAEAMEVALHAEQNRDFSPTLQGVTVGLSSGTSGHRGLFLVSPREQAAWAGAILARALHRLPRHRLRVAFFLRSNSNLYEEIGGTLIRFRYFDLMLPLPEAVTALNDLQPHIIVGPPSLLHYLALERQQGRLNSQPQRLISVAEVLEPQDQQRISELFHAPVHQIYQCTEGLLAVSCAHGSLHIQEDGVALQFEPLEAGNDTRVMPIVTDLWRKTQPIIRYRLNDVLQLETQSCPCGSAFRVIRSIEGRCDDICFFSAQDGTLRPFYPDTIRRMILLACAGIADYQVIQASPGHLDIRLAIDPNASFDPIARAVRASVDDTIAQYACQPAHVRIGQGLEPLPPGVKRRRVQAKSTREMGMP